ncbi:EAL protein [Methyloversatilis universalis FAM5]|jgi:EAL and modified HD-GYP domain-containing signal transduction protein|uniref:EAL protein n=1 Tax=Methyloversatilis universalis (strain ATCC BAA-1314 / DSM 25237 / JCM 13912 / CCUG 52030 / FAM5) TaxID=1000565 RepID=F5RB94_METUF|nr:EAL domain-containing protein [Methyloversatilis universalis]EGK72230.1 EAL protein [Methyloversatilis universalis FAM5]
MLTAATNNIYVGRQPILDRSSALYAYELLFRSGHVGQADFHCNISATARVITSVFNELGLERSLGNALGFINVSEEMLMSEAIELLPADKIVIELLETVPPTPEVIARSRELVRKGFRLALDDVLELDERFLPLIRIASFIKIDLMGVPSDALADLVERFRPFEARLLAEKVDSAEQAAYCHQLGFSFFQGYYFARPSVLSTRTLTASETTLLRLLGMVMSDADTSEMEPLIKQEPALLVNLMRITNSVGSGSNRQISTVREAITLLGRRQLQRWLQLLLFCSQDGGDSNKPLLNMVATRARTMELLAERCDSSDCDPDGAFLTGILSLLPSLLGVEMDEVLRTLAVDDHIRGALIESSGSMGTLLTLLRHWEEDALSDYAQALDALQPLTVEDFNLAVSEAMSWAADLGAG